MATSRRPPARPKPHHRPKARFLPSVTAPADQTIIPGTGELTLTGYAPTVQVFDVDPVEDLSHELLFVHKVELPGYTFYSTVEGLEETPIYVAPVTFTVSSAPLAGFNALIKEPGRVAYEAFPSGRTPGVVAPTYGDVEYINVAGNLESLLLGVPTDGAKLTCYRGYTRATYPDDFEVDFIAYINGTPKITMDSITISLRDRSGLLNALVCEQTFDHSLSDATEGRRRRVVYGEAGYPGAILYIPFEVLQGNTWFLQLNEPGDVDNVYDGGVQLVNQGQASSLADLFSGTVPNPSSYRWFYDDGTSDAENRGTWIRLGSKVRVELRYRANGDTATVSEFVAGAGITGAMDSGSVDLDIGARVVENQTYREVLEDVAKANLSIIGFTRLDEFFQRYLVPSHSTEYDTDFTFTDGDNCTDWQCYPLSGLERRIRELQVNAGATEKGQLAGIPDLDGSVAEALSREQWLTKFTSVNAGLAADDPSADTIEFDIEANHFAGDEAGMLTFAAAVHALFGGIQVFTWVTAQYTPETAALQLMDRVSLISPESRMTHGKKGRIISIERQLSAERIVFGLWTHYSTIPESAVTLTAIDDATTASAGSATSRGSKDVRLPEAAVVECMANDTAIDFIGDVKTWPAFPYSFRLASISAAVNTPQASGSPITVEVFVDGQAALSVPITIDNGDTKSADATTQPVLAIKEIGEGQKVVIKVSNYGDGTATGLVVTFTGIQ